MAVDHEAAESVIEVLRQRVTDKKTPLPAKYRALFALRNLKGPAAEQAIISGGQVRCLHLLLFVSLGFQDSEC